MNSIDRKRWNELFVQRPMPIRSSLFGVLRIYQEKSHFGKGRVVVNIRGLKKISELDANPMPLQTDILASVQGCSYISIMDCASFFHQWPVEKEDRHKLTVLSHRGSEQWNLCYENF